MSQTLNPDTAGREITFTRRFEAPRDLVFRAWTEPEHLKRWWGPRGFSLPVCTIDLRPGGAWHYLMTDDSGQGGWGKAIYDEIDRPRRLVFNDAFSDEEGNIVPPVSHTTVTFEENGGATLVTIHTVYGTAAELDTVIQMGMEPGMNQTLDRLAEELASAGADGREIRMARLIDAPRERVFEAWTKPEHMAAWWGPRAYTLVTCEMDLRPGGSYRFVQRDAAGEEYPFKGVYREVSPPDRLVFTQIFDVEPFSASEAVATVTLTEHDGRTLLTGAIRFPTAEDRDGAATSDMQSGMAESYDRLAAYVEQGKE
jgi:uncharacterized protein YndB with AHSA1/START domain